MQRRELIKNATLLGASVLPFTTAAGVVSSPREKYRSSSVAMPSGAGGMLRFSMAEYERRYQGVRKAMEREGIDALVIIGTHEWSDGDLSNIRYLGAPVHLAELSLMVLPLEGKPIAPYSAFGFPTMPPLPPGMMPPFFQPGSDVDFEYQEVPLRKDTMNSPDYAAGVVQMLKKKGYKTGRIGFVSMKNMPADIYAAVAENFPKLERVDAQHILLDMRLYKSEEEIAFMKRSGYIADKGLEAMIDTAGIGVSDFDVFYAIDKACAEAGAPVGGFQLYGSGPWQGPPGSSSNLKFDSASARTIQKGDMLIPEVASNYKGYFTQLTVPASIGEPPESFLKAYEMCATVHGEVRKLFKPGATVRQVDAMTAEITEEISKGEFTTLFGIQAGEHEYSFWHTDYELRPGAMAYNQPFFLPKKKPGGPFHVFGDAMVMTDDEPIILHQSKMDLVIIQ